MAPWFRTKPRMCVSISIHVCICVRTYTGPDSGQAKRGPFPEALRVLWCTRLAGLRERRLFDKREPREPASSPYHLQTSKIICPSMHLEFQANSP